MRIILGTVLLSISLAQSAVGQSTANEMLRGCTVFSSNRLDPNASALVGYVTGYAEAARLFRDLGGPKFYCTPEDATVRQSVEIVCKYIVDHRDRDHLSMGTTILAALGEAWPCQK
jgi:hypothetical protein